MKKLILSTMLVMVFLTFSNDREIDKDDFNDLKSRVEATHIKKELKQKRKVILSNVFRDERLLFNNKKIDKNDFEDLKLRAKASSPREELKRKMMLNHLFW